MLGRAGLLDDLAGLVGFRDLEVGDPEFDKAFVLKARDPDGTQAFLGPNVRAALLSLEGNVKLTDVALATEFSRFEESTELLLRACHDVVRVAALMSGKA